MIRISKAGSMRSPVIVIGRFAAKFARNKRGRASNLYEAKLYRSVNAARRALLCPVLWVSQNGAVQIMRAAEPLTEMMTFDEYGEAVDACDTCPERKAAPSNRRHPTGDGSKAGELPLIIRLPPGTRNEENRWGVKEAGSANSMIRSRRRTGGRWSRSATLVTTSPACRKEKRESLLAEWQAAIEALMLVSRSGPTMPARIGVMKALHCGMPAGSIHHAS